MTVNLQLSIRHIESNLDSSGKFLPSLVKSARHQVVHRNARVLVYAPAGMWRTLCGWYCYSANYSFEEGDDSKVTCAKCQMSAQEHGGQKGRRQTQFMLTAGVGFEIEPCRLRAGKSSANGKILRCWVGWLALTCKQTQVMSNLLLRIFRKSGRCLCLSKLRIIVPGCWEMSCSHVLRSAPFRAAACDGCASVTARLRMWEWI